MPYDSKTLDRVYRRTDGQCHICHEKLARSNYSLPRRRGAWEVDHSVPRAKGGTNSLNNLVPACIKCNRKKGAGSSRSARAKHGKTRMPLSREAKNRLQGETTLAGAGVGAVIGGALGGPPGALLGGFLGAVIGKSTAPDA